MLVTAVVCFIDFQCWITTSMAFLRSFQPELHRNYSHLFYKQPIEFDWIRQHTVEQHYLLHLPGRRNRSYICNSSVAFFHRRGDVQTNLSFHFDRPVSPTIYDTKNFPLYAFHFLGFQCRVLIKSTLVFSTTQIQALKDELSTNFLNMDETTVNIWISMCTFRWWFEC